MALLITAAVAFGFSHTVRHNLIDAHPPRPWILYLHGAVFSGWLAFFILQSTLVRVRRVRVHRTIGWFGLVLGAAIPVLGLATVFRMVRFNTRVLHEAGAAPFMSIQFNDLICFAVPFVLAILWRKRPEFHRRLILVATCAVASAGVARIPQGILPRAGSAYVGVDLLIVLGIAHDLLATRRVHPVYRIVLPAFMLTQGAALYLDLCRPTFWMHFVSRFVR